MCRLRAPCAGPSPESREAASGWRRRRATAAKAARTGMSSESAWGHGCAEDKKRVSRHAAARLQATCSISMSSLGTLRHEGQTRSWAECCCSSYSPEV